MAGCCSSSSVESKAEVKQTARCPGCGATAKAVAHSTLLHQVVAPLNQQLPSDDLFFCASSSCSAVYFSNDGVVIDTTQVRGTVGQKSTDPERTLCYCFDVSHARVMDEIKNSGHSSSKAFVVAQTKLKNCACDIRNPSGKCCLKEFPK